MRAIDLSGMVFGRLTVIEKSPPAKWLCLCECGREKTILGASLRSGATKSCGCIQKDAVRRTMVTHGQTKSAAYRIWAAMLSRCYNPNTINFCAYGARGVKVCGKWFSFEAFLADMGHPPQGRSLDRIDNNRGYSPDNCRWATRQEQDWNKSRNIMVDLNGSKTPFHVACRMIHTSPATVRKWMRNESIDLHDAWRLIVKIISSNESTRYTVSRARRYKLHIVAGVGEREVRRNSAQEYGKDVQSVRQATS